MARVIVRSRRGNVVLAVLGAIYTIAAVVTLVAFAIEVWNAASISDVALHLGLIAAAACGVWLVRNGLENLGVELDRYLPKWSPHFMHRSSGSH